MPGLLAAKPPRANGGLLQPVIWDRLRTSNRLGPLARGESAGGGGVAPRGQSELPLRGGVTHSRNVRHSKPEEPYKPKFKWAEHGDMLKTRTKSGVTVEALQTGKRTDISFWEGMGAGGRASMKRGISRFEDVYRAVRDYVKTYEPKQLKFTPLSRGHERLYDRVAPKMADDLGGRLQVDNPGYGDLYHRYTIYLE